MTLIRLMVRVSPVQKKALRKLARKLKVSESQVVRDMIDASLIADATRKSTKA